MKKALFIALLAFALPFISKSQTLPVVETGSTVWVEDYSASGFVKLVFRGSDPTTLLWMEYGEVGAGFTDITDDNLNGAPGSVSFDFEDLNPETDYMCRAVAGTYDGIVYGDTVFFRTLPTDPVEIEMDHISPYTVIVEDTVYAVGAWAYANINDLGEFDALNGVFHYGKNPNDLDLSAYVGFIDDEGTVSAFLPGLEIGYMYHIEFCITADTVGLCSQTIMFETELDYDPSTNYELESFDLYQGGTCAAYLEFELEDVEETVEVSVLVKSADGNVVFSGDETIFEDEGEEWEIEMGEFADDFNIDTTFSVVVTFDDGLTVKELKGLFNFDGKGCIEEMVMDSYIATTHIDECTEKVEFFTSANETDEIEIGIRKTGGGPIVESEDFENGVGYGVIYFDPSEYGYEGINTFKAFLETEHDISDQLLHDALVFETNCGEDEEYTFSIINEGDACQYWISVSDIPSCFDTMTVAVKKVGGPIIWEYNFLDECGDVYLFDVNIGWYGEGIYKAAVQLYDGEFAWTNSETFYYDGGACGKFGEIETSLEMNVYPNPTSGSVTINAPEYGSVEIENLSGEKIGSYPVNSGENYLDFDYPSGMYLIRFMGEDGTSGVKKMVIQ